MSNTVPLHLFTSASFLLHALREQHISYMAVSDLELLIMVILLLAFFQLAEMVCKYY